MSVVATFCQSLSRTRSRRHDASTHRYGEFVKSSSFWICVTVAVPSRYREPSGPTYFQLKIANRMIVVRATFIQSRLNSKTSCVQLPVRFLCLPFLLRPSANPDAYTQRWYVRLSKDISRNLSPRSNPLSFSWPRAYLDIRILPAFPPLFRWNENFSAGSAIGERSRKGM